MAATGTDADKSGTVRLTASVFVAHYVLPNLLAELRQREPLIQIELVASDTSDNLLYRDADIALRMYRPDQLDVVTRHLSDIELGIFAAKTYLDRRGKPEQPDDLLQHDLVGYDRNDLIIRTMRQFGWDVTPETFATRCDSQSAYWELVRSGCGIGFGQAKVARRDSTLEQVLHNLPIPTLPVWIAAPNAVRHSTRVAAVWDHLVAGFTS